MGPGELMVIDTRAGRILHSAETDDDLKSRHPYKEWMEKNVRRLVPFEDLPDEEMFLQPDARTFCFIRLCTIPFRKKGLW